MIDPKSTLIANTIRVMETLDPGDGSLRLELLKELVKQKPFTDEELKFISEGQPGGFIETREDARKSIREIALHFDLTVLYIHKNENVRNFIRVKSQEVRDRRN